MANAYRCGGTHQREARGYAVLLLTSLDETDE